MFQNPNGAFVSVCTVCLGGYMVNMVDYVGNWDFCAIYSFNHESDD